MRRRSASGRRLGSRSLAGAGTSRWARATGWRGGATRTWSWWGSRMRTRRLPAGSAPPWQGRWRRVRPVAPQPRSPMTHLRSVTPVARRSGWPWRATTWPETPPPPVPRRSPTASGCGRADGSSGGAWHGRALAAGPWPTIFMIEHDRAGAEWTDAERAERAEAVQPLGTPVRLRAVTLGVDSVTGTVGRLGREFALLFRPALVGGGARDTSLGRQTLRLAPARPGEPLMTIDLQGGRVARELDLLGCRWRLSPG